MNRIIVVIIFASFVSILPAQEPEFDFSFEKDLEKIAGEDLPKIEEGEDALPDFNFEFEEKVEKPKPVLPPPPVQKPEPKDDLVPEKPEPAATLTNEENSRHEELVDENLELRKRIAEAEKARTNAQQENEHMSKQVADLEDRIRQSLDEIKKLQKDQEKVDKKDLARVSQLENELSRAEQEKNKLGDELVKLRKEIIEMIARRPAPTAPVQQPTGPRPGSDLFKKLEKENAELREKYRNLQEEASSSDKHQKDMMEQTKKSQELVELARSEAEDLRQKLEKMQKKDEVRDKLLEQIPQLDQEIAQLRRANAAREQLLSARERELREIRSELEVREERLQKIDRMQKMIAAAEEKVQAVSNKEKRDMHYNMAVVYYEKGQFEEAEQEYLRALRLDPTDADVHYNLGMLYDDELNSKRKALMHYKRYLKLRPHANDLDQVRGWIRAIEMH